MNIKQIVKNNKATFSFYRAGYMDYEVTVEGQAYRFPVSLEDLGTATLLAGHKAITLMRYIRKALEDRTFVKAIIGRSSVKTFAAAPTLRTFGISPRVATGARKILRVKSIYPQVDGEASDCQHRIGSIPWPLRPKDGSSVK